MNLATPAPARHPFTPPAAGRLFGAVLLAVVLGGGSVYAQDAPSPSNGLLLPDESLATHAGATSLEVNPAGLGFVRGGQLALGLQRATADYEGVTQTGIGAFLAAGTGYFGAGFGATWLDRPELGVDAARYRKYTLGAALSSERNLSLGAAFNFFGSSDSSSLDALTSWDLGLVWRPSEILGFGLRLRDLNQPFFEGPSQPTLRRNILQRREPAALPVRIAFSSALRLWQGRAVLEPGVALDSRGDSLLMQPRVFLEPVDGVQVFARTQVNLARQDSRWSSSWEHVIAGLAVNLDGLGIESSLITNMGTNRGITGSTHLVWLGSQRERSLVPQNQRWVLIDLLGQVDEQPSAGIFVPTIHSFMDLAVKLEKLAADDSIEGVVFNVGETGLGYAQIWEVRQAIKKLRQAGKSTVSILTNPTFRETYLASAAEQVWLIPAEPYAPDGLTLTLTSYAQALANLGVQAEFLRIGRFKSAPESYTFTEPSDDSLAQTDAYLDRLYERTTRALADDRGMEPAKVLAMIDQTPLFPSDAITQGFVDGVLYPDQVEHALRERFGAHVRLEKTYPPAPAADMRWGTRPQVAVVVVSGMIVRGQSGRTPLVNETISGSDSLTEIFYRLENDHNVGAVVVRVDSPGGSAVASDLIYRAMRRLAEKKPVIASMGNTAASGGYYTAAGADEIFATPNTLTGSIGIFAGKFSIARLAEFIGLSTTQLQRGQQSGGFSVFTPWTDAQRTGVARSITYLYHLFIQQVARTRALSAEQVDAVARGHIWDGEDARTRKLVDQTGGLIDAMHHAALRAGLQPDQVDFKLYPQSIGLFDATSASVSTDGGGGVQALLGVSPAPTAVGAEAALGTLLRRMGRAILVPMLYADAEPLMLLPFVVEMD